MNEDTYNLDEFFHILDEPITGLVLTIEHLALEKGIPLPPGVIREKIKDAVEDIHFDKFLKKEGRKVSIFFKRKWRWLKRKLK